MKDEVIEFKVKMKMKDYKRVCEIMDVDVNVDVNEIEGVVRDLFYVDGYMCEVDLRDDVEISEIVVK